MIPTQARVLEAELDGVPEPIRTRVLSFRLLLALGGRLRTRMDRRLEPTGVTTQQAACLMIAGAVEAPLAQGEVARMLGVSHQNVRQLTTALERKGLLRVEVDPRDRRTKRVRVEASARALFEGRNAGDFEAVASWFGGLDDREAAELLRLLKRVAEGLPAAAREATASDPSPSAPRSPAGGAARPHGTTRRPRAPR